MNKSEPRHQYSALNHLKQRRSPHKPLLREATLCDASDDSEGHHHWRIFSCPPFSESRKSYKTRRCGWIGVWLFPWLLAGFGFFLQNYQLRIGTYYYVHKMLQYDLQLKPRRDANSTAVDNIGLTIGTGTKNVSFGSLDDPVEAFVFKYAAVNISTLDMLAVAFPFFFVILTVAMDLSRHWTRVMLSFFLLSVGKGLFSWLTVVPDSNGWQVCLDRLSTGSHTINGTTADVKWYSEEHTLLELLLMDPRSRLCADMMWSGHTYFVALFALGLHECTRLALRSSLAWKRILAETLVTLAAFSEQGLEICLVLSSRFHYTSDVVMAIIITYLVYTNITVASCAQWWAGLPHDELVKLFGKDPALQGEHNEEAVIVVENEWFYNGLGGGGSVSLGCCCCPWSQQWIHSREQIINIMDDIEAATKDLPDKDPYKMTPEVSYYLRKHMSVVEDFSADMTHPGPDQYAMSS